MTVNRQWKKVQSKYIAENPWYKVRQDRVIRPDGTEGTYNVIECGESVFIVPITKDKKILLVKLFRYTTQHEAWEVPAGGVEAGETPLVAAKRELQEETGYTGTTWQALGSFESMNGMTDAVAHVFEASGLNETQYHEKQEEGIIKVQGFSFDEAITMILEGSIVDGLSIAALMQFFTKRGLIKKNS